MQFIIEWELKGELVINGKDADSVAKRIDKMSNWELAKTTGHKYTSRYFTTTPLNKQNPQ